MTRVPNTGDFEARIDIAEYDCGLPRSVAGNLAAQAQGIMAKSTTIIPIKKCADPVCWINTNPPRHVPKSSAA